MTKTLTLVLAGLLAAGWTTSAKANQVLTGDTALACEAILCLAAGGARPQECAASIAKYFSISATKPSRLKAKRKGFLELCPSGEPALVESLVNGQCNPNYQNCPPAGGGGGTIPRPGEGQHETQVR